MLPSNMLLLNLVLPIDVTFSTPTGFIANDQETSQWAVDGSSVSPARCWLELIEAELSEFSFDSVADPRPKPRHACDILNSHQSHRDA
jgi:hypothetical protein